MKHESIPPDFRIEKRSCMVLLGKAIRAGWPMSAETRESIVQQLSDILKMKDKPRWVLRATELMLLMDKQNTARVI